MSDQFNIDNFETFIRHEADKHRMYPNNQVWQNINEELHGKNRWPALTFSSIIICLFLIFGFIFFHPDKKLNDLSQETTTIISNETTVKVAQSNNAAVVQKKALLNPKLNGSFQPFKSFDFEKNNDKNEFILNASSEKVFNDEKEILKQDDLNTENPVVPNDIKLSQQAILKPVNILKSANKISLKEDQQKLIKPETVQKKQGASNKWSLVIYGAPSISYRVLSEPDNHDSHIPYNPSLTGFPTKNVNDFVHQRPSYGVEGGAMIQYSINDRLKIKGGLQLSYRQYTMDAYKSSTQQAILLLDRSTYFDTIVTYSNIRNIPDQTSDKSITTFNNHYIQIGIPLGIDWTFKNTKKVNFHAGLAFQPTYQINKNAYVISGDYNHYVQMPDLVRHWNFNVGAEILAEFKVGKTNWLMGPQIKYQILPSEIRKYSIQERLIDYGFKIGIVKYLR